MPMQVHPQPSPEDLVKARQVFEANEPRNLFYRAATELIALAKQGVTSLSLAEALAVLLQTWNKNYYRFRRFDTQHFADIDRVLAENADALATLAAHTIEDMESIDGESIRTLFKAFEQILGPVGAAKSLHLLVPTLFPLWDGAIAKAYRLALGPVGTNAARYWKFMQISKAQCNSLKQEGHGGPNYLKALDEYNYCVFTHEWLKPSST